MGYEITVAVVQSGFHPEDYLSAETFAAKVSWCFETINIRGKRGHPRPHLVVFPELTGLWIPLLAGKIARSLTALVSQRLLSSPLKALRSLLSGRGVSFVFLNDWEHTFHAWIEPFREAARLYDTFVCPGSIFLPDLDWEAAAGWQRRGNRIWNSSCLINPKGKILGWTRKINLTPEEMVLGIKGGSLTELTPYQTDLGNIGILVCKDGFHERAVERLDRQGCRIVLMPSANPKAWMEPPRTGTTISQEKEWLSQGLGSLIQGRENISLSINPMSVSWILEQRDEGLSNVFVNRSRPVLLQSREEFPVEYNGYPGLEIVASRHDCEEILSFSIEE